MWASPKCTVCTHNQNRVTSCFQRNFSSSIRKETVGKKMCIEMLPSVNTGKYFWGITIKSILLKCFSKNTQRLLPAEKYIFSVSMFLAIALNLWWAWYFHPTGCCTTYPHGIDKRALCGEERQSYVIWEERWPLLNMLCKTTMCSFSTHP